MMCIENRQVICIRLFLRLKLDVEWFSEKCTIDSFDVRRQHKLGESCKNIHIG